MIKVLTDFDKRIIIDKVKYTEGCNSESDITIENILKYWVEEKQELFHMFGDQLRLMRTTNIAIYEEIYKKLHQLENTNEKFLHFIMRSYNYSTTICRLFNTICLKDNRWHYDKAELTLINSGKVIYIHPDTKILPVIRKISADLNCEDKFESFATDYSMIFNKRFQNLEFCLSIHPYDYMTMSDNACGWTSCMSWDNVGEYRRGTVEMMNSPYVVVAYLRTNKDEFDKAWRQLFIVHKDIIVAIKGYPYHAEQYTEFCLSWLKELASNYGYGPYDEEPSYISQDSYREEINDKEYSFYFSTDDMYNDFFENHLAYLTDRTDIRIHYSGEGQCLCCGRTYNEVSFTDPSSLFCECCDNTQRCEICDSLIHSDDPCYEIDGLLMCDYCYENETFICPCCEETHYGGNAIEFEVREEDETIGRLEICDYCYSNDLITNKFGPYRGKGLAYWGPKILDIERFSERGKENYKYYHF